MEAKMKKIEEQKNKNEPNDKSNGSISAKNKTELYKQIGRASCRERVSSPV